MEDYNLAREHRRQAAMETMVAADPARAEADFKEYFESGSSAWTGWDQHFVDFIEKNRRNGLFYGDIGAGWHFLFSPSAGDGFWICTQEDVKGKGFLAPEAIAALTEVAVEKGLFTR
jgi:hypothetical protein